MRRCLALAVLLSGCIWEETPAPAPKGSPASVEPQPFEVPITKTLSEDEARRIYSKASDEVEKPK